MQNNLRTSDLLSQRLLHERKVLLWGEVNDASALHVVERLLYLESIEPGKEITLLINSPGGHVHSGFTMYDCMQGISSPVSTLCTGMAASKGAILLSAGAKGRRFVQKHARIMIHQPSGGVGGTSADIDIQMEELIKTKRIGAQILADNCGHSLAKILKDFDRDHWMDAEEAVKYGIVDAIA